MLYTIKNISGSALWQSEIPDDTPEQFRLREALCIAKLQGADLQYADLQYADLQGAKLQGARLQGADLIYAKDGALQINGGKHAVLVWKDYVQIGCRKFNREQLLAAEDLASEYNQSSEFVAFMPMLLAAMDAMAAFSRCRDKSSVPPQKVRAPAQAHNCRCEKCGVTGVKGAYPFSTMPGFCDDCA